MKKALISIILGGLSIAASAVNIPNPVIKKVADAGVMRYNGKYYLGGVRTFGDFYVSDDLVNWGKPVHVIDMDNDWTRGSGAGNDQIHANDIVYLNGDFHLYWSVNYWGRDRHAVHIVHATAKEALGPYIEPVKTTWLDNRIDPKVFRDDDGTLYMYMVRFTDGNAIWCRKMKNPAEFAGDPVMMFSSQPGTWETMDNRVAEGPWVIKYRGQYYMMYNANHTGHSWGNYQLGVSQADSLTGFNTGNKYSHPVVGSNQTAIDERYTDMLRYSAAKGYTPEFAYTTEAPAGDAWSTAAFDDSKWLRGECGFASSRIEGSTSRIFGTKWDSGDLWLRKTFLADVEAGNVALRVTHDGDTRILLNGVVIYDKKGADYCIVNLTKEQRAALRNGENVLAVHTARGRHSCYFNVSLFDLKDTLAEDILFTPGQPNIVRGVNGFEWWLVYMANRNLTGRDQYIDRVQFFDRKMWVDGITGPNTPGYHPLPAKPTFAIKEETAAVGAFAGTIAAEAYLVESNVRTSGDAGVLAWWVDEHNNAKVGVDAASRTWYLAVTLNGVTSEERFGLPCDFKTGVYHSLRVERYAGDLTVSIDDLPAPGCSRFSDVIPATKGVGGLFDNGGDARFEGTIFTVGFDDRSFKLDKGAEMLFGEALTDYEMSFQLSGIDSGRKAGCYPAYTDARNYVRATIDGDAGSIIVDVVAGGKTQSRSEYSLGATAIHYPDVKYSDGIEKTYRFDSPTWLDAIYLNRHDADRHKDFVDNMFGKLNVEYFANGSWHAVEGEAAEVACNPMYNVMRFKPVRAEALRFINREPTDTHRHIYKIGVSEKLRGSYNVRTVRRGNKIYLFIDGKQICNIDVKAMKASRTGFCQSNYFADYRGVLYYHIGE